MRLNRRLQRPLNRRLGAWLTTRIDGRPYRPPDYFKRACDAIDAFLRLQARMAKRDPHIFGPYASRYFQDTVAEAARMAEWDLAIRQAYGPAKPETPPRSVWMERYFQSPEQMPTFRKWFRERYG